MLNAKHTIALATVILSAFLAPVAVAQPVDPPIPAATSAPHVRGDHRGDPVAIRGAETAPATVAVTQGEEGFQWGDAALGAAAMLAGLGIGAALLLSAKRGRERDQIVAAS
jgi:hypothetical protein